MLAGYRKIRANCGAAMNDPYQQFMTYLKMSDELIGQSSKGLVAETARVLDLMVAGYQVKFGDISAEKSLRLLRMEQLRDEDAAMLAGGLETLVGVLGTLREEPSKDGCGPVH
jgi:hypothetical protein